MRNDVIDGVATAVAIYTEHYPELTARQASITTVVKEESNRFQRTIEAGIEQFEKVAGRYHSVLSGEDAFKLHDTFGFPLELTRELAAARGLAGGEEGFEPAMAAQRARSRGGVAQVWSAVKDLPRSEVTGYQELKTESAVTALRVDGQQAESVGEGEEVEVYLQRTPFYAESGGQIGDTGLVTTPGGRVRVEDTQKPAEAVIAHIGTVVTGEVRVGETAIAAVDVARRRHIARHHSATHLLHRALRETLGEQVVQKGSWVGPDHTTFDIPLNRAMTGDELTHANRRVMDKVREALPFHEEHKPLKEAIAQGAMHLFEEKYGDVVRVGCFGDWGCWRCGGTHVANTADIGTALIISESSIGSGLRRIDMVVGEPADALVRKDRELIQDLARSFNAPVEQLRDRVATLRAELKAAERERLKLRDEVRTAKVRGGNGLHVRHGRVDYIAETVEASSVDELAAYADRYLEMLKSGIVTVVAGDKFVIKVSKDLTAKYDANRLGRLIGTGGGPAHLARGRLSADVSPEEAFRRLEAELA